MYNEIERFKIGARICKASSALHESNSFESSIKISLMKKPYSQFIRPCESLDPSSATNPAIACTARRVEKNNLAL